MVEVHLCSMCRRSTTPDTNIAVLQVYGESDEREHDFRTFGLKRTLSCISGVADAPNQYFGVKKPFAPKNLRFMPGSCCHDSLLACIRVIVHRVLHKFASEE